MARLEARAGRLARCLYRSVLCWLVMAALSWPATAQVLTPQERSQLEAQKAQLFQQTLRNPANLDATFAYAEASARLGDDEAAVAALERLLLFNPNLAAVDLELGALYFRMGSYQVARIYLDKALAAKPSPQAKARAEEYLAKIIPRLSPQRLTGLAFAGVQYQSDANVAPSAGLINSPIGPILLNNQFVKHADTDLFGAATALYTYDLGTQNGDTIEVGGTGYASHYFRFTRLDLDLLEVTAGPRFVFPSPEQGVKTSSIKPYAIVNEVGLGLSQYFYTYGGGIEGTALLPGDLAVKASFEYRQKTFSNAPERPLSTGLDGNDKLVSLSLKQPIFANSEVGFEADYLDQETQFAFYANQSYALSGGYRVHYDDPTRTLRFPWETAVYAGYVWSNYDAPDPCCNTSSDPATIGISTRHDRRWRFGIAQTFQVSPNIAIVAQYQRDIVSSNLPLYAYSNNSVLVGPQIRF